MQKKTCDLLCITRSVESNKYSHMLMEDPGTPILAQGARIKQTTDLNFGCWPRCMVANLGANIEWFDLVVVWIVISSTYTIWHLIKWASKSKSSGASEVRTFKKLTLPSGRTIAIYD